MVDEIETILKHSGVGLGLTEGLKDKLCRSIAIDLNNYFQEKLKEEKEERGKSKI